MIAPLRRMSANTDEELHDKFMLLMPRLCKIASHFFKEYDADKRDDAMQSVLVTAFEIMKQLAEKGRLEDAYANPIAKYAIGRYREGRLGGLPSCSADVFGERCRWLGRSSIKHFGLATEIADSFESEATVTDARYPVQRQVQFKMDFMENWYRQQTPKDQEIIRDLARGETTNDVSRKFGLSAARISQLRRKYSDSWYAFINPVVEDETNFIDELKELADAA